MQASSIEKKPLFVHVDATIHQVIVEMINLDTCNAMVFDNDNLVIGIFTERDILRKLSLLEVEAKLNYKVSTIMSRPVHFVPPQDMWKNIKKLHLEHGFRHFPILEQGEKPYKDKVQGMVTASLLFHKYIETLR